MEPEPGDLNMHWAHGIERMHRYRPGRYHPVVPDDILHQHYRVVDKLGFGGYSTIRLAHDIQNKRYVAVKVGTSGSSHPRSELDTLRALTSPNYSIAHGNICF